MNNFKDLLDYCQAKAISNKLEINEESFWNHICRQYSKKFHTPLKEVYNLDPEHVVLTYYEEQLQEIDVKDNIEQILDIIYSLEDADYDQSKEKEIQEFIKQVESKEKNKQTKINKPSKKTLPKQENLEQKNNPQGGYLNLGYLENQAIQELEQDLGNENDDKF
jgi:hypothetical protein